MGRCGIEAAPAAKVAPEVAATEISTAEIAAAKVAGTEITGSGGCAATEIAFEIGKAASCSAEVAVASGCEIRSPKSAPISGRPPSLSLFKTPRRSSIA